MRRTAVINVVGLTERLLGHEMPPITAFQQTGSSARIVPAFPAVTCTAQSTYLTGATAEVHGIVGNGWYNRELAEVQFWKQSNLLVHGKKIWEELREQYAKFTCAKLFWWYNMYSTADYSITPRPMYLADGRKVFDIYAWPYAIRTQIKSDLGEFPFPAFWGPAAGVETSQGSVDAASQWVAESAKWVENSKQPTLSLIYLPHLDYNLQRFGPFENNLKGGVSESNTPPTLNPEIIPDLRAIDNIVGDLIDFFAAKSVQVILLSEYGITPVNRPIHLNRLFREQGWLAIKDELGLDLLDYGASKVFAVADHQVAHIYLNDFSLRSAVCALLDRQEGIEQVLESSKTSPVINHCRAGDLIAVAAKDSWFTYYYWLDDAKAPDFARTVDIHRKPGYDPVELFLDPGISFPKLKIAWRLLQKKLGLRMLMDMIPLDATLVKGSHGRKPEDVLDYPMLISGKAGHIQKSQIEATEVYHLLKQQILE